ncbi:hypothetical protein POM88_032445 [Heracleum sosnowskyi]|uniref:Uncharacterized protein n=1 Tax=Heracleum sosnowskyi TaxID=360622 RepID=A0AAD8HZA7_9APIA|nr:hypothetical protein POM88_032445 [Heracleum sosnowskyi]
MDEGDPSNNLRRLFSSEEMVHGYKVCNRARKRRNNSNKENFISQSAQWSTTSSQTLHTPVNMSNVQFTEKSPLTPSSSGIEEKKMKKRQSMTDDSSSFRSPLGEISNSKGNRAETVQNIQKFKSKQAFCETGRVLFAEDFNRSADELLDSYDDQIEESIIGGASLSDDVLFDSDDSYEEFLDAGFFVSDSENEDELFMDTNIRAQIPRRSQHIIPEEYNSLGGPSVKCTSCNARMWKEERVNKNVTKGTPIFSMCCKKGDVKLPPTPHPPNYLMKLYNDDSKSATFQRSIRIIIHIVSKSETAKQ